MNRNDDVKSFVRAALIAAVYVTTTVALSPISYGPLQVRVAEALTLLPLVYPEAVPGLVLGCLLSNMMGGLGMWDIGLGTLATLIASFMTLRSRNVWVGGIWPILSNGVIVGSYLSILFNCPWGLTVIYVAMGEAVAVYGIGMPLIRLLLRRQEVVTRGNRLPADK